MSKFEEKIEVKNNDQSHKFEKKENIEKLHEFSKTTSQEIIQKYGNVVNEDVTINMKFFNGNVRYTEEEIKEDEKFVEIKEKEYKKEKSKDSNGQLFEEAIVCILYRILKKEYLVVRSSYFDDLCNGIDIFIIDPKTNEIICAVDDITTFYEDLDAIERKEEKVLLQNMNGGAEMKYGLAFKENKQLGDMELTGEKIKEIPIFSMHLSGEKFDKLLNEMDYDISNNPSEMELEIFDELVRIMEIDSREMQTRIQAESEEEDAKMVEKETELNYLLNVKMKDMEHMISKAGSEKRKKRSINEKKAMEKDIKSLKDYIKNFPVRKKNKTTSLSHLKGAEKLFEKIKKTRNENFSKIDK